MAALFGVKAIANHVEMSESTVTRWIENEGLPAAKFGGTWTSDTLLIRKWLTKRIAEQCRKANAGRW